MSVKIVSFHIVGEQLAESEARRCPRFLAQVGGEGSDELECLEQKEIIKSCGLNAEIVEDDPAFGGRQL